MKSSLPQTRHEMQPARYGLDHVIARSLRKVPAGQSPLLAWPLACGSSVSERTRALDFREGILRVEVADAGWRRELQALAPRYLATINRYGGERVTRIDFVVASRK